MEKAAFIDIKTTGAIININRIQYPISDTKKEEMNMKIAIGCDPNAEEAKQKLLLTLKRKATER